MLLQVFSFFPLFPPSLTFLEFSPCSVMFCYLPPVFPMVQKSPLASSLIYYFFQWIQIAWAAWVFLLLNLRSCSCCCVRGNLIKEKEKYIVFRYHIWLTQKTERANESVHFYTVKSLLHFQSLSLSGKENTEMVFCFSSIYINPPKRHQTCRLMQSNSKSALKE